MLCSAAYSNCVFYLKIFLALSILYVLRFGAAYLSTLKGNLETLVTLRKALAGQLLYVFFFLNFFYHIYWRDIG